MKKPLSFVIAFLIGFVSTLNAQTITPTAGIVYVKKGSTGSGSSWTDAAGELADALKFASISNGGVSQIWVAGGVYKPLYLINNPSSYQAVAYRNFLMVHDLKVYGGFAGNETTLAERNLSITANRSTLSGDIDDVNGLSNGDAYHVVIALGNLGSAELNGFTITGGYPAGLSYITINGNYNVTMSDGGALYTISSAINIANVIISGNGSLNSGYAVYNYRSNTVFSNVIISGNSTSAMYNISSYPALTNVTISGNPGGVLNIGSGAKFYNSVIYGNNFGVSNAESSSEYKNCLIQGNPGGTDMVSYNGATSDIFTDPSASGLSTGEGYGLKAGSPALNKGNNNFVSQITDLVGNARIRDNTVDLGAYELQSGNVVVVPDANGIVYVKQHGAGNLSGNSWANATPELADALRTAKTNTVITQIWVAGGVYKPLYQADNFDIKNTTNRDNSFVLVRNVKVYGGFAGVAETSISQRDLTNNSNKSTLSGDFDNSGALSANDAIHVIIAAGTLGSAELNGFTVSGGYANSYGDVIVNEVYIDRFSGGGIFNIASTATISNVTVAGNSALYGGGVYTKENASSVLNQVIITGNSAGYGGGLYNSTSSPKLTNVSINGNYASYGGGVYNQSSTLAFTNVTLAGNTVETDGSELYLESGTVTVQNSIIFGSGTNLVTNPGGTIHAFYSLVSGINDTVNNNLNASDYTVDQIFANQAAGDYTLKASSHAINSGSNDLYAGLNTNTKDLANNRRLQREIIDMGAYESSYFGIFPTANGIVYVKKGAGGVGSSWSDAVGELADALVAAKTNNAITQIWVAGGVYKPLYSPADNNFGIADGRNNTFSLVSYTMVYGGFAGTETTLDQRDLTLSANKSILSGDFNGDDVVTGSGATLSFSGKTENAYHVVVSVADEGSTELNGFTITGGNANAASSIVVNGQNVGSSLGGGMANISSGSIVANLIIKENSAVSGGGMMNYSAYPRLYNSTLNSNYAVDHGGGMADDNSQSVLNNLFISGNNSSGDGGGIYSYSSGTSLGNTTISGNVAAIGASELYLSDGSLHVYNSILIGSDENAVVLESLTGIEASYSLMLGSTFPHNIDASKYTPGDIFTNPSLGDYTLKAGSVALNAGSDALYESYSGSITTDKDIAGNPRLVGSSIDMGAFEAPQSVLPVTLISFTASLQGENNVLLQWSTASELNNKGFEIEMSRTGKTFQKVGFVMGNGTTRANHHYQSLLTNLSAGVSYFRLKIIDMDDSFTYSTLRHVTLTNAPQVVVNIFPNPITGTEVYMNLLNDDHKSAHVKIMNTLGGVIHSIHYTNYGSPIKIEMPEAPGMYIFEITAANGVVVFNKVLKL